MTYRKTFQIVLLNLGVLLLTSQAHAVAISNASIKTSEGAFINAADAYLGTGKAKNAINGLTGLFAGDPWTLLDTTKKPSKEFNNTNFVLSADRKNAGSWGVTWGDAELAQPMDFVLVLKTGGKWGAYLFQSGSDFANAGSIDGLFQLSQLNQYGKVAKLRRAFIFGRYAANDDSTSGTGGGSAGGSDGGSSGGSAGGSSGGSEGGSSGGSAGGSSGGSEGGSSGGSAGGSSGGSAGGSSGGSEGGSSGGSNGGTSGPGDGNLNSGGAPTDRVNPIPAPGSLALLLLGLGLALRQVRSSRL